MKRGRFDADAAALKQRLQSHERYGSKDLNAWIFEHLSLAEGQSILDLGCGTGKQTLPLARRVGDRGEVLGVDISREALEALSQTARGSGLEKRITLLALGLDELEGRLSPRRFDRALASYSLYYARDPRTVLEITHRALKPRGLFFFCGPSQGNNAELKRFHYALRGDAPPEESGAALFMERTGQELARGLFPTVEVFAFENPLGFDSAEALQAYWSSYNLYDENMEREFKAAAERHFQKHPVFETVKRVLGVRAMK